MSAQLKITSTLLEIVCHALQVARLVHPVPSVPSVSNPSFFKETSVKLTATTDLLLWVLFVKDAQLVVFNVLRISSAITVLIIFICTRVSVTMSALLELLVIAANPTGSVFHAILHARPV